VAVSKFELVSVQSGGFHPTVVGCGIGIPAPVPLPPRYRLARQACHKRRPQIGGGGNALDVLQIFICTLITITTIIAALKTNCYDGHLKAMMMFLVRLIIAIMVMALSIELIVRSTKISITIK